MESHIISLSLVQDELKYFVPILALILWINAMYRIFVSTTLVLTVIVDNIEKLIAC